MGLALLEIAVHGGRRTAETLRGAADLVQREQPVVEVEGGVLEPLGHDRRGHLLKLAGEAALLGPVLRRRRLRVFEQHHVPDKIEEGLVQSGVPPPGPGDGRLHIFAVGIVDLVPGDVGSVDGEAGDDVAQGVAQAGKREIARRALPLRQAVKLLGKSV